MGEAKFMRAFLYFYLVEPFWRCAIALSTDPNFNTLLARTPKLMCTSRLLLIL
jgi:hypothetical protein